MRLQSMLDLADKQALKGDRLSAIATYQKILSKQPRNMVAIANLAKLFLLENKHNLAIPMFEQVLKFFPKSEELYKLLMICHTLNNDYEKARSVIDWAEQETKNTEFTVGLKMELLKTPSNLQFPLVELYNKGDLLTCEIGAWLNLAEHPDCTFSAQMIAKIEHDQGKIQQAFLRRKKVLERIPNDAILLADLSSSYLAMSMLDESLDYAKKALSASSHNPSALKAHHDVMQALKQRKTGMRNNDKPKLTLSKKTA